MRQRVAAYDWSLTSLGPVAAWPPTLTVLVELLLSSQQPMFLAWGMERVWIYNDAFVPIAGPQHPAALARPAADVWSQAWPMVSPMFEKVFAGKATSTRCQGQLDRDDGFHYPHVDCVYTPVRAGPDAAVLGLLGVCSEAPLQGAGGRRPLAMAERERTRILALSRDLFAVASVDGRLRWINPSWSQQLDRPHAVLLAQPFSSIIHPDDLHVTGAVVEALKAGRAVHQFHVRLLKADGTPIAYAWSAVPELDPANGTFYTVGRDITEEMSALRELESARDALRQTQKMDVVGQLTGGLAHDFNNLMAGVSASLQVLRSRLEAGTFEGATRYIDLGLESVERAATLTQRLLAFSRRQTLDPKPLDINRMVRSIEDLVQRTLGPAVDVRALLLANLWPSMIDASQLESSLLNLCVNAHDAMPDGGRLTIETSNEIVEERAAQDIGLVPGDYVRLCVRDTGVGMDAQVKARVFEPFFTTKPLGQGTGLGLSMVYGFVRQSGGGVRIDSEEGVGTSVSLYMPRYRGQAAPDEESLCLNAIGPAQGETIVVVEDESTIRVLLTEVLEDAGYRVLAAGDGAAGLSLLQAPQRVDLLLTDVGLPGGMNGRQVADAARTSRPTLKVLFVTGYANTAAVGNGLLPEGMDVMTKPFEVDALMAKVVRMLHHEPERRLLRP